MTTSEDLIKSVWGVWRGKCSKQSFNFFLAAVPVSLLTLPASRKRLWRSLKSNEKCRVVLLGWRTVIITRTRFHIFSSSCSHVVIGGLFYIVKTIYRQCITTCPTPFQLRAFYYIPPAFCSLFFVPISLVSVTWLHCVMFSALPV
jgi:hypothetical protein